MGGVDPQDFQPLPSAAKRKHPATNSQTRRLKHAFTVWQVGIDSFKASKANRLRQPKAAGLEPGRNSPILELARPLSRPCILAGMPEPQERALIQALRAARSAPSLTRMAAAAGVRVGIGDDCAVLRPAAGREVLVTTDFCLETIHFHRDWHSPESAGHRCLARGLSDLAAMGAKPAAAFLSLALPPELMRTRQGRASWRERFLAGLLALADRHGVPLAGGDTARSPAVAGAGMAGPHGLALADIVLVGTAPRNRAMLRSTAQPGDRLYLTGWLGGAAAELAQVQMSPARSRRLTAADPGSPDGHPHLFPEPRLEVGAWLLRNRAATAAIDLSDGLSTDLDHLCEESGLAAVLDRDALPIHPLARKSAAASGGEEKMLALALHGGEDYELLFTASPRQRIPARIGGIPVHCIGRMRRTSAGGPRMILESQRAGRSETLEIQPRGWEH